MKLFLLCVTLLAFLTSPSYAEMYKWVDDKGTVHFTDDLSAIPEKFRESAETRKPSTETGSRSPQHQEKPTFSSSERGFEEGGITVPLLRKHELLFAEVVLNGRVRRYFIVDTGASFTLINKATAQELGIREDENTPYIRAASVSGIISAPLISLGSVRVGKAEVENVEALVFPMAASGDGLLGNSFLNKFRVVIDSMNGKMTLHSMQGTPSPDRPGGYGRDYWVGQFRFYNGNLEQLRALKAKIEGKGASGELVRINNAIRYFENQVNELERKASFAGVPRNWRQ